MRFNLQSSVSNCLWLRVFVLLLATCDLVLGQDVNRAKGVVETLASPFFHGRGYVNSGDSLAAEFVAKEFKSMDLKPFFEGYFQKFEFPVNTFPDNMSVKVNGKLLSTGKDYILDAGSEGIKGSFKVIWLDSSVFSNSHFSFPKDKKQFTLAYPAEWEKRLAKLSPEIKTQIQEYPVLIRLVAKKLTFTVAKELDKQCTVEILASRFPAKAKKIKLDIENKFVPNHVARNVIGYLEGTSKKDSFLLISAHYDHLGQLGKNTFFPGANDNASGVAMMLELAHYYANPSHRLSYSIVFIGFSAEEAGLVGSQHYVNHPLFPLSNIKFMLNLDLMGSGKEGITAVNGSILPKEFALLDSLNKVNNWLPKIVARGKAANSDHYPFSEKGVPAFFLYTLGEITAYHDIDDKPEVVTFSKFKEVFELIKSFFEKL